MIGLKELLTVSQIIIQSEDLLSSLDKLTHFIRPFFIFDNLVIYSFNDEDASLEVVYARSTGRGRSKEADITWGETIANQVVHTKKIQLQLPESSVADDRLKQAHILAVPLIASKKISGVAVFIRYGGPKFKVQEKEAATLLCNQIVWLLERLKIQKRTEQLDTQHAAIQLQEDFVNTISHELQNPLGFIKGYTTTLMRQDAKFDSAMQKEFLQIIDSETDHLSELISNLLDSARIQSGHFLVDMQLIRIDALIKGVIKKFKRRNPDLTLSSRLDIRFDNLKADANRLTQVFENLLENAVRYAPGSEILITGAQDEKWISISVQDFGPGIEKKFLPHIFERFFRTPESSLIGHGTGLGLYICKQIMDAHKGRIEVVSKVGAGTIFNVLLPRIPENNEIQEEQEIK